MTAMLGFAFLIGWLVGVLTTWPIRCWRKRRQDDDAEPYDYVIPANTWRTDYTKPWQS